MLFRVHVFVCLAGYCALLGMVGLVRIICAGSYGLVFVYIDCVAIFCGVVLFVFGLGLGCCCYGWFVAACYMSMVWVLLIRFGWRWRNADFLVLLWIGWLTF